MDVSCSYHSKESQHLQVAISTVAFDIWCTQTIHTICMASTELILLLEQYQNNSLNICIECSDASSLQFQRTPYLSSQHARVSQSEQASSPCCNFNQTIVNLQFLNINCKQIVLWQCNHAVSHQNIVKQGGHDDLCYCLNGHSIFPLLRRKTLTEIVIEFLVTMHMDLQATKNLS